MRTALIRTGNRNSPRILMLSTTAWMTRSFFFWPYGDAGICAEFRDEIRWADIGEHGPAGR